MEQRQLTINLVCAHFFILTFLNASASFTFAVAKIKSSQDWKNGVLETLFPNHGYDLFVFTNLASRNYESTQMAQLQIPARMRSIFQIGVGNKGSEFNKSLHQQIEFSKIFRHTSGYIHAYFLSNELHFSMQTTRFVKHIMMAFRVWPRWSNWPNDFAFFTNHRNSIQARIKFYKHEVPRTFARGFILDIDLSSQQVSLVCLQCPPESILLSLGRSLNTSTIASYHQLTGQMHGGILKSFIREDFNDLLASCKFMSRSVLTSVEKNAFYACFHLFLQEKLNYTCITNSYTGNIKYIPQFSVWESIPFIEHNYKEFQIGRLTEWIPFSVLFKQFHFLPVQRSSAGDLLTKPYDWITWISIVVGAISLAIITLLFQNLNLTNADYGSIGMNILATIVDQDVARKFTKRILFSSQVLPCLWFLWIFMMIIIANGYTGLLFSLMTNGETLAWPASLKQLILDPSYCIYSGHSGRVFNRTGHVLHTYSRVRYYLINPTIEGKLGNDDFLEQLKGLNKSLKFIQKNGTSQFGVEQEIVEKNANTRGDFIVGRDRCSKFAVVEEDPREDAMFVIHILDDVIAGNMVAIRGHLTVMSTIVQRNFFHEPFLNAMAHLQAGGILAAAIAHVKKWYTCSRIYVYVRDSQFYSKEWRRDLVQCVQRANEVFGSNGISYGGDSGVSIPISVKKLASSFNTSGFGLTAAFLAFLYEIVKHWVQIRSIK